MKQQPIADWIVLGLLILAALTLRLFMLGTQDIWWDEARNIFTASRPLDQIASAPELDIHPPLYFYLLHFWLMLVGIGEFAVRFFSVWFGIATIPLAYRLGVYVKDQHVGLWAAFLTALAPFLVDEAQQARMYTLLVFLSALSIYFLLRAVNSSRRALWVTYMLTAMLSFYAHYSFIYVLAAQNLFLLIEALERFRQNADWRGLTKNWLVSQVAIVVLYLPQVPNILRQMGIYGNPGMQPPPLAQYLAELTEAFLLGTKIDADRITWLTLVLVTVLICALLVAWRNRQSMYLNRGALLLVLWFVVPFATYFIVLQKSPQFTPRYAMVATLPLYVMIGFVLASISRRSLTMGIASAVLITGAYAGTWQSIYTSPAFQNDDTRGLAQFISENATSDDVVFIDVPFPFFYYYRGNAPAEYLFVDPRTVAGKLTQAAQNKKRLYFIRWFKSDTDPQGFVPFLLEKYTQHMGDKSFRGYDVTWYQLPQSVAFSIAPSSKPAYAIFDDKIKLVGFAYGGVVTPQTPDPNVPQAIRDSKIWVTLWWQSNKPMPINYKVSVQLWDENGNTVAQDDRMMIDDHHFGTSLWKTMESTANVYMLELENVKIGEYSLHVIVYDPITEKRLELGPGNEFELGQVQVVTR